jgi:hypothetical protein
MKLLVTLLALAVAVLLAVDLGCFLTKAVRVDTVLHPRRYRLAFLEGERDPPRAPLPVACTICCLLRDVAPRFEHNRRRVELLRSLFRDCTVLLFENDSSDASRALAAAWASASNGAVRLLPCLGVPECRYSHRSAYSHGLLDSRHRIERMTHYRNRLLATTLGQERVPDVVAVYDFDIEGTMSWRGVHAAVAALQGGYDAIFANGRSPLPPLGIPTATYDSLAYVAADGCAAVSISRRFFEQERHVRESPTDLVPVRSAFNGLALYRTAALYGVAYRVPPKPFYCEHIGLHQAMHRRGAGRFAIHRALVLHAGLQGPPTYTSMARTIVLGLLSGKRACIDKVEAVEAAAEATAEAAA